MRKLAISLLIVAGVGAALGGCAYGTGTPAQIRSASPTPPRSSVIRPVLVSWDIGDRPVVSSGGFTFAANLVVIDGSRVIVVYSLSGPNTDQPLDGKSVQFTDESGNLTYVPCPATYPVATQRPPSYPVLTQEVPAKPGPTLTVPPYPVATQAPPPPCTPSPAGSIVTPLAQLGQLQLGAVTFSPYVSGRRELHLLVNLAGAAKPLDVFAAKITGPSQEDPSLASFGAPYREGYLEQAGYRISFNGYDLAKGDWTAETMQANTATGVPMTEQPALWATQAAAAASWTPQPPMPTSTLEPINPAALALSGGKPIRWQATLRVEDLQSHQAQYLFIVFLTDGEVKASLVQ